MPRFRSLRAMSDGQGPAAEAVAHKIKMNPNRNACIAVKMKVCGTPKKYFFCANATRCIGADVRLAFGANSKPPFKNVYLME